MCIMTVTVIVKLRLVPLPPQPIPLPGEDLVDDVFVADNVAGSLDLEASIDLDVDGTRPAVFVDHGDAAVAGAVLLNGVDDGAGNGVGVVGGGVVDADEVVVARDFDRGVDAQADGGLALVRVAVVLVRV